MPGHLVSLEIPESVYDQIKRAAERARRPVDDVLVEAVTAVAPVIETDSKDLKSELAQLAHLNDAALWQAGRATMTTDQRKRLHLLHDRKAQRALTSNEEVEEDALLKLFRETLLVRAQAALILKQRGYDVSDSEQFAPLE